MRDGGEVEGVGALPRNTILTGDALTTLRTLPGGSVDCVVTSPPYYQLRDYRVPGQLGVEPTVAGWVADMREVAREVARVLVPTGSLWLNLGDSFSRHPKYGAPTKGLLLAPERLLLALANDGWLVRTKVIWAKSNPMPSSVTDRLSLTYEVIYFLVRQKTYFFDLDAIREPHRTAAMKRPLVSSQEPQIGAGPLAASRGGLRRTRANGAPGHPLGKNAGDVWTIPTRAGYGGSHFATFPPELVRRPLLATCPAVVCTMCVQGQKSSTGTLQCICKAPARRGIVLDPFLGSGTTALVAQEPGYRRLLEHRVQLPPATFLPPPWPDVVCHHGRGLHAAQRFRRAHRIPRPIPGRVHGKAPPALRRCRDPRPRRLRRAAHRRRPA